MHKTGHRDCSMHTRVVRNKPCLVKILSDDKLLFGVLTCISFNFYIPYLPISNTKAAITYLVISNKLVIDLRVL